MRFFGIGHEEIGRPQHVHNRTKENKEKLSEVAWAVKHVTIFRPRWADFFKDRVRIGILQHHVSN